MAKGAVASDNAQMIKIAKRLMLHRVQPLLLAGWLATGLGVAAAPAQATEHYRLEAEEGIAAFLQPHLPALADDAGSDDEAARLGLVRRLRQKITDLLATEGYFSPKLDFDTIGDVPVVKVEAGQQAKIASVELRFKGPLGEEAFADRREALRNAWLLPEGEPFRQTDWSTAKDRLLQAVATRDFAAASLNESLADVDPQTASVHLHVSVESGPAYGLGPVEIEGLGDYGPELVARYNSLKEGEPYSAERLLALQTTLQNTPYFSAVEVEVDREATDPAHAPVKIRLVEAKPRRMSVGVGYSSNTGARFELGYRDANFADRAWQLSSGVRLEQKKQAAFSDLFFPPDENGARNSVGALVEHSDISGLVTTRQSIGIARNRSRGDIDTQIGLSLQRELRKVADGEPDTRQALALNWAWTRRQVDSVLDPRRGYVFAVQLGGGARAALSDANFVRSYGRLAIWLPITSHDVLSLRGEAGYTATRSRSDVPEEFLFRTGGAQTVRGYAYQGLGVKEGSATVGGRYMSAASVELTHWLDASWGVAGFVDAGNAADDIADGFFRPKLGLGLGVRWRSPAGPIAFDLAYGRDDKRVRPHISISIAF